MPFCVIGLSLGFQNESVIVEALGLAEEPNSKRADCFTTDGATVASLLILGAVRVVVDTSVFPGNEAICTAETHSL